MLDSKEAEDLMVSPVLAALTDLKAPKVEMVLLENLVQLVPLVTKEKSDCLVFPDTLVDEVSRVLLVLLV